MSLLPLRLAVVGHTNTGKTSLLRTLARDVSFGEVSDRPATTRSVSGMALMVEGDVAVEVYDTPGLEDSIGLLEALDAQRGERRVDGPEQIEAFLESPPAQRRFVQEAKTLRQVLQCDAALYVIDARDRVLPKYRDELEILARCGRPVVPVLNFVAPGTAGTFVAEWRDQLARVNLHAVAEFDTVVYDFEGELRLFGKIRSLLDRFASTLTAVIDDRRRRRSELLNGSAELIAALLVDAAQAVEVVDVTDAGAVAAASSRLQDRLRRREQRCVDDLLRLHRFRPEDAGAEVLPIVDGRWGLDLFSPAALRRHGVRAGGGAAAGAAVGVGLDLAVGGLSLGAATAVGAAIGAVLGALGGESRRLFSRVRGRNELRAGAATLRLLALRQIDLSGALLRRGHAAQHALRVSEGDVAIDRKAVGKVVDAVNDLAPSTGVTTPAGRASTIERLAGRIRPLIPGATRTGEDLA